jgi:hypothetical protein
VPAVTPCTGCPSNGGRRGVGRLATRVEGVFAGGHQTASITVRTAICGGPKSCGVDYRGCPPELRTRANRKRSR